MSVTRCYSLLIRPFRGPSSDLSVVVAGPAWPTRWMIRGLSLEGVTHPDVPLGDLYQAFPTLTHPFRILGGALLSNSSTPLSV